MKRAMVLVLSLAVVFVVGCRSAYRQTENEILSSIRFEPVWAGQPYTITPGVVPVLIPGRALDFSNEKPKPYVIYMRPGSPCQPQQIGSRCVSLWEPGQPEANIGRENVVACCPGQVITYDEHKTYALIPGPTWDYKHLKPKPEVVVMGLNGFESPMVNGGRYVLLPSEMLKQMWLSAARQAIQGTENYRLALENQRRLFLAAQQPQPQQVVVQPQPPVIIQQGGSPGFVQDMYMLQQMNRQTTQDMIDNTRRTLNSMDRSVERMNQNNRETLGILEGARQMQNQQNRR